MFVKILTIFVVLCPATPLLTSQGCPTGVNVVKMSLSVTRKPGKLGRLSLSILSAGMAGLIRHSLGQKKLSGTNTLAYFATTLQKIIFITLILLNFIVSNLRIFLISQGVNPCKLFPAQSNISWKGKSLPQSGVVESYFTYHILSSIMLIQV